jgi:hypothetical protein
MMNPTGNVIWNTSGRRTWVKQLICMVNINSAYKIWVIKQNGKRPLESHRFADGIKYYKMCLRARVCDGEDWIMSGHSRVQQRLLKGNMRRLPQNMEVFTDCIGDYWLLKNDYTSWCYSAK